jgi:transcriptional regulator with XRE-family HTH domain
MHIGKRIREIREAQGMMQKDLAVAMKLSTARVSGLEKYASCPTKTLESACDALGVSPSFFYSGEEFRGNDPESIKSIETEKTLINLVRELGMDYLVLAKWLKDNNLSPEVLQKTISQLKEIGLLQNLK